MGKERLRVVSLKRVPGERFEYSRVELAFESGETCVIVYGGGAQRSKCRPVYQFFTIDDRLSGKDELYALWDKQAERISLFGSQEAQNWLREVADEPMDTMPDHKIIVPSPNEIEELSRRLAKIMLIE